MSMPPSPWAPRPGYRRSSALPQTPADSSPLPGVGQRYQVHRATQGTPPSRATDPEDGGQQHEQVVSLIPPGTPAKAGAVVMLTAIVLFSMLTLYFFSGLRDDFGPVVLPSFLLALIPLGGVLVVTMLLAGVFWYVRWEPRDWGACSWNHLGCTSSSRSGGASGVVSSSASKVWGMGACPARWHIRTSSRALRAWASLTWVL